jgi:two-component system OmpR family sensor kinase
MRRPGSLAVRSIVAAAAAVLVALAIVGAGVDVLVGRHLRQSLDESLRTRAVEVAQLSASAPGLLTAPGALDSRLGGLQLNVEVVDRHGRIVSRSLALGGRVLPVRGTLRSVVASGTGRYVDAALGSGRVRVYVGPLADTGGPAAGGAVAVAASTHDLAETVRSVRLLVLLSACVAAFVAAVVLAVSMRRALRPLGRLAVAATEIERTGDVRRRLPDTASGDEIGALVQTLNRMLGSLERARERERRFLADASHELRTPLTALLGNASYLRRHGPHEDVIADLEQDARRLALLADDLLVLAREEASAPLPREIVRLDELARAFEDEATGVHVDAPAPVLVRGDRAALERALVNLVENARRHGPTGGLVAVTASAENGVASVAVTDEGPGLPPERAADAFERFWRGSSDEPGSGLGLAIVRATAERHGGRAYADGARFVIELPALMDLSERGATTGEEELAKGLP